MTEALSYDVRPGEGVIVNTTSRRQAVTSRYFTDGRARPYVIGLEPESTYIVAMWMGGRDAAAEIAGEYGSAVILDERVTRGAVPLVFKPEDSSGIGAWLRGPHEPSLGARIEAMRGRHDLPDLATSTAAARLVKAGFPELEAAGLVKKEYEAALRGQGLYRQDWARWTDELIASREGAEV